MSIMIGNPHKIIHTYTCLRRLYFTSALQFTKLNYWKSYQSNFCKKLRSSIYFENTKYVYIQARYMAGHSKWQNIRHIKAAKDAVKASLFSRLLKNVRVAIKEGGGNDPKFNSQLASAIDVAKSNDVPNIKIEATLKENMSVKSNLNSLVLEIKCPGGCIILVDTLTENSKTTKVLAKTVLNKFMYSSKSTNFHLLDGSTIYDIFAKKGLIEVIREGTNMDKALEDAIEVGAEEVLESVSDTNDEIFEFWCDTKDLHQVKKSLMGINYTICFASFAYQPKYRITVGESDMITINQLIEKMEDIPEVVRIYDNIA